MTVKPLWLVSPAVEGLLTLLVDRLDSVDLQGAKAQSVVLTVWSPGCEPMLAALLDDGGYSPEAADKQSQRPAISAG